MLFSLLAGNRPSSLLCLFVLGVDDDGLESSKSVQMFAHQLFGSDATVLDSCIMIAVRLGYWALGAWPRSNF